MMSIEDHIHQAFSLILKSNQEAKTFDFEGESLGGSRGAQGHDGHIDLSGQCGLLGVAHPLLCKAHLYLALRGSMRLEKSTGLELYQHINDNFSQILGKKVFIQPAPTSYSAHLGRIPSFLTEDNLRDLEDKKVLSLVDITGEALGLGIEEREFSINEYSFSSLYITSQVSRLLLLGQFYGNNGLIKRREALLKKTFEGSSNFKNTEGLVVSFQNPIKSNQVITKDNQLLFPLSFDEQLLKLVTEKLKEDKCI
jgi:hypothetical protein